MRRWLAFVLGMAAATASPSAQEIVERPAPPRVGAWQSIGPEGATVLGFATDPARSGTIYALTPQRLFRSIDGGVTWVNHASVPSRFPTGFTLSPGISPVFFVTDTYEGLLRSEDGGKTWKVFELGGDIGEDVTVDPSAPDRVWAAVSGGIWRSTDRGQTWERNFGGVSVLVDRNGGDRVFAGSYDGIYRTLDSGSSWQKVSDQTYLRGFAQDPARENVLFGWRWDNYFSGIVKSIDGGSSWSVSPQPPGRVRSLAVDADGNVYATTGSGLSLSRDGGSTWAPVVPELAPGAAALTDSSRPEVVYVSAGLSILRTTDRGATFSASKKGLVNPGWSGVGLDQRDPRHLLVGTQSFIFNDDLSATYTSRDGGWTWAASNPAGVRAFAVDPVNPERVYGAGGYGVFRSDDGGTSWTSSDTGIEGAPTSILMDPLDPTNLLVGTCCGVSGSGGGVFQSANSGTTWRQTFGGPDPPTDQLWWVISLAADPQTGVMYAAGRGGLKRSTNHGGSWTELGPFGAEFVAVDPLSSDRLYVVIGNRALQRSDDGGASWTSLEGESVTSVVPSPSVGGVVYAATLDRGILRSEDYGDSWESWSDGLRDLCIATMAIDAAGETLVAGTCSNGVYVRTVRPPRDPRVLTR